MGEVKETIKGSGPKKKPTHGNLVTQMKELKDEVSRLTAIKDDDTAKEGDTEKPENIRKVGHLRAVHSLLTAAQTLLEDY